jgi:hypothetical protein
VDLHHAAVVCGLRCVKVIKKRPAENKFRMDNSTSTRKSIKGLVYTPIGVLVGCCAHGWKRNNKLCALVCVRKLNTVNNSMKALKVGTTHYYE